MINAKLRVCASCEWVFKISKSIGCPKCGFAHYGARCVFGAKAYLFSKTQEPWVKRKLNDYNIELLKEIDKNIVRKIIL